MNMKFSKPCGTAARHRGRRGEKASLVPRGRDPSPNLLAMSDEDPQCLGELPIGIARAIACFLQFDFLGEG